MTLAPHDSVQVPAQQLVRYEVLFKLLDDMQSLDDINELAQLAARQWKHFANVNSWRVCVRVPDGYLQLDGYRGTASVKTIQALAEWDAHYWTLTRPRLMSASKLEGEPGVPDHLGGATIVELQVIPVHRQGRCVGLISVGARHERFSNLDHKFIRLFGGYLTDHIVSIHQRNHQMEMLEYRADRDGLTGAWNRRAIMEKLKSKMALSARTGLPLSVLMVDADFFKRVNDQYGHPAGDEVLRELSRRFETQCRSSEDFGRYGGEEFIFVLCPCTATDAANAAERIRAAVADHPITIDASTGQAIEVTISLGGACSQNCLDVTPEALLRLADEALYQSKANGRNQVTLSAAAQHC